MPFARSILRFASAAPLFASLVAAGAFTAGARRANADETPPQLHKVGETVTLSVIGANIVLPDAPAGWALSRRIETSGSYDVLRRQDPTNPQLEVSLNRPSVPDCAAAAGTFQKLGLKRHDASSIAPPNWAAWAFELPFKGDRSVQKLCTNTPQGPVLATVEYEGTVAELEPAKVRPLLQEIGAAVGGRREAAGGLGVAPVTTAPSLTTLPITGIRIALPSGWTISSHTLDSGQTVDMILRRVPERPVLLMQFNRLPSCNLSGLKGTFPVSEPAWLPSGFQRQVHVKVDGAVTAAATCAPMGSGHAIVVVSYEGSLTDSDVLVIRSILAPITEQQSGVGATGSSSSGDTSSSSRWDDDDDVKPKSGRLELSGFHFAPPNDGDAAVGGWASVGALRTSNDGKVFGVGFEVDLGIGYGSKKLMPWDVKLGIGASFLIGPVSILPLVGIGADGIGGQDDYFKMKGAAYYYYGGRAGVQFSPRFGLEGSVGIHGRGTDTPFDRELRWTVSAMFRTWGLGIRVHEYGENAYARFASAGAIVRF